MSGESSNRSDLVDITYQQLHSFLSRRTEGHSPSQVAELLRPRLSNFRSLSSPFGTPSDASRSKIEANPITLPDGVVLRIESPDRDYVHAISTKFHIDQVQAFILLRAFLYNGGSPPQTGADVVDEFVEALTPFYLEERLFVLRVLAAIFQAQATDTDLCHDIAPDLLSEIIPNGQKFAESLLTEYLRKTQEPLPESVSGDPRTASRWAKQNQKEQLVFLEILFWTMWGYVRCSGPMVAQIFETAYQTNLGSVQRNGILLLDEEGTQLQQDSAGLWILITVEVLELEKIADGSGINLSAHPDDEDVLTVDPDALLKIHQLVVGHGDSQYACTFLAWAFVVARIVETARSLKEVPERYRDFLETIQPHRSSSSYAKGREPAHAIMTRTVLEPQAGLFRLMLTLLTSSPLFVISIAWSAGSTVTDPNAIAFRSVFRSLLMALVDLVPVEQIPDYSALVDVWISLFGRSEPASIKTITCQYWVFDFLSSNISRRAILDVARCRFPIHFRPFIRLLRSMTAAGFLDTDDLSTTDDVNGAPSDEERVVCARSVFEYVGHLSTFTTVVRSSQWAGNVLYEKTQDRHGGSFMAAGYINLKPIKLPGGSILPARSTGRLLNGDSGDLMVLLWEHEHSGWKIILEILTDYVNQRRIHYSGMGRTSQNVSFDHRRNTQAATLRLQDIGVEMEEGGDEGIVTDALDLVRSVIQDNPPLAEELLESLEAGEPVVAHTMLEAQPPDMVQLTTMILEEALSRSGGWSSSRTQLITSAMSVLSGLLAVPKYSNRVWLYIRSTTSLFGSDKTVGFTSAALAAERVTGHYTMTLALLNLVQHLFHEASSSILTLLPANNRLHQVKEEVMLRAARFVHAEVWVEHLGWKYAQLGDRFAIGRRVSTFFSEVLKNASPSSGPDDRPFTALNEYVVDVLLLKATTSTINPLVSTIAVGGSLFRNLNISRRYGDARCLIYLLESHLQLTRLVLNYKQRSSVSNKPCLLEQALCARVTGGANLLDTRATVDPIDVLASYVKDRSLGTAPQEAMRVLYAICSSLSSSQPSPATIISHLSDPEATVASFVRIVQHPYDELSLRISVWNFIALAVDKEPALASLFVTGQFRLPNSIKGKGKADEENASEVVLRSNRMNAIGVAKDMLAGWRELWGPNPQLLASVLRFLDVVWQHGLEHKAILETARQDMDLWHQLAGIVQFKLDPTPDYRTASYELLDGIRRSSQHAVVSVYAYRALAKSYAVHIIGLDIGIHLQSHARGQALSKPISYTKIETQFKTKGNLADLLSETLVASFEPKLYDELMEYITAEFPALTLEHLESQEPVVEREYGDDYTFSTNLLQRRLLPFHTGDGMTDTADEVEKRLMSLNLNLSLTRSQMTLAEAWQVLLRQVISFVRGDLAIRPTMLSIAATISSEIANEKRSGDMASTIHKTRLTLLLSLLEDAWFSAADNPVEIESFMDIVDNVHAIILNESQAPLQSIIGALTSPFHRTLLQVIYFCSKHSRNLILRPKALTAEHRLRISGMLEATLTFVIESLRIVFDSTWSRVDIELDRDMELLVSVFEQCTRPDTNPTSTYWLTRCQETDVVKTSLNVFVRTDLVGLNDLPLLLSRQQPLYAPHLLMFHMALASIPAAAERLANEGVLVAYSNNGISAAISTGMIDVVIPELPGKRNPAHRAYCSMLAIVAGVVSALGRHNHYFDADVSGFVQLYGDQISRALSWTISDAITFPLLEEMEQVVNLFTSIADGIPFTANTSPAVQNVLRVFTTHALLLLQQLNYGLTHPNHLASLLEPVTAEDRSQIEADAQQKDPQKRSMPNQLFRRLLRLSHMVLATLISISRADYVLIGEQEDWPIQEALIIPHSKVVLGEPASLGTLLELGRCTLDHLQDLQNPAKRPTLDANALQAAESTARRNLEAVIIYAVTQLAMWLSKPEFDASTGDLEMEEQHLLESQRGDTAKDRRTHRPSLMMAERLRRGIIGELATDLQSLLDKAKVIKPSGNDVDLTQVLSNFLRDRIVALVDKNV